MKPSPVALARIDLRKRQAELERSLVGLEAVLGAKAAPLQMRMPSQWVGRMLLNPRPWLTVLSVFAGGVAIGILISRSRRP